MCLWGEHSQPHSKKIFVAEETIGAHAWSDWMVLGTDVGFQVLRTALLFLEATLMPSLRTPCVLGKAPLFVARCCSSSPSFSADFPVDLCHACPSDPPLAVPEGP